MSSTATSLYPSHRPGGAENVEIDGRDIVYDFADLDQLTLAYSVSIHKYSQGKRMPMHHHPHPHFALHDAVRN
ncbi:MAG: hypothetical protein R2825_03770 [Saprospiraceae bacterium]